MENYRGEVMEFSAEELAVQYIPVKRIPSKIVDSFFDILLKGESKLQSFEDESFFLYEEPVKYGDRRIRVSLLEPRAIYAERNRAVSLAKEQEKEFDLKRELGDNLAGKFYPFLAPKYREAYDLKQRIRTADYKEQKEKMKEVLEKLRKGNFNLTDDERLALLYAVRNFQYFGKEFAEILKLSASYKKDILEELKIPKQTLYAVAHYIMWNNKFKKRKLTSEEKTGLFYIVSPKTPNLGYFTENLSILSSLLDKETAKFFVENKVIEWDKFWKDLASLYEADYKRSRILVNLACFNRELVFKPEEILILSYSDKFKKDEYVRLENGIKRKVFLSQLIDLYRKENLDLFSSTIIEKASSNLKKTPLKPKP